MIPTPLNPGLLDIVAALAAKGEGWEDICVICQIKAPLSREQVKRFVLGR
ncbi:MAG: hypothetical protein AB7G35_15110 [Hyphomicrobiaceae bacterium]